MRVVVQRVDQASVTVEKEVIGKINEGLLVYLSIGKEDGSDDCRYIVDKISGLRIFEDSDGKMNLSCLDKSGQILVVSNFTLHGDCRKGRRPSFNAPAPPDKAEKLYEKVIELLREKNIATQTGKFAASMKVESVNAGPVTLLIDSHKNF
jgi:D-tyrosyl-tRNA(Tyr) deacylase